MALKANSSATLKKLQQQVAALRRKEKASNKKLRDALAKAKKMGKDFRRKLNKKTKEVKFKVAAIEVAVYQKLAASIKKRAKSVKVKKIKKSVKVKKLPAKRKTIAKRKK